MTGSHQCGGRLLPAPWFYFRPETHGKAICRPFFLSSFTKQRQRLVNRCKSDWRDWLCFGFFFAASLCLFPVLSCWEERPVVSSLWITLCRHVGRVFQLHSVVYGCALLLLLLLALFPVNILSIFLWTCDLLGSCYKIFTEKKKNQIKKTGDAKIHHGSFNPFSSRYPSQKNEGIMTNDRRQVAQLCAGANRAAVLRLKIWFV